MRLLRGALVARVLVATVAVFVVPGAARAAVYFSDLVGDTEFHKIQQMPNTGGVRTDILTGERERIYGLAVDATNLYWANSTTGGTLNVLPLAGGAGHVIGTVEYTQAIAVQGSLLYLADHYGIDRVGTDGSGFTKQFVITNTAPYGVASDGAFLYWSNYATGTIGRANLDGSAVDQVF